MHWYLQPGTIVVMAIHNFSICKLAAIVTFGQLQALHVHCSFIRRLPGGSAVTECCFFLAALWNHQWVPGLATSSL